MSESRLELRMLRLDEIRPNPFQPRETFPREEIQELADSIKSVGLIQPISVRKKGKTYQIIAGERRWRACQFAGLKEIPAIVKDVDDSQLMVESLVENVQRRDLAPLEKARGLAEIYRLNGFDPFRILGKLTTITNKLTGMGRYKPQTPLTEEEEHIKKIADTVGLSYGYQYEILSQLRLTPEEQKRATELKLSFQKIATISTIEDEEDRKRLLEIAPDLEVMKVQKASKIIKRASKPLKEAILRREVEPEIAEDILMLEEPEIQRKALDIARKGVYTREGFQTRLLQLIKPRMEMQTETVDVQIFNKTIWNLERLGDFDFYTIGYEKKTIDQFITLLKSKKIETLVDARKNPISQYKPEFTKNALRKILRQNDIKYVHYPELGVPSEIRRKLYETGDYDSFFKWYDENVLTKGILESSDFKGLSYPISIMCVELDPTKCHRHRIALALERKGLKSIDL